MLAISALCRACLFALPEERCACNAWSAHANDQKLLSDGAQRTGRGDRARGKRTRALASRRIWLGWSAERRSATRRWQLRRLCRIAIEIDNLGRFQQVTQPDTGAFAAVGIILICHRDSAVSQRATGGVDPV